MSAKKRAKATGSCNSVLEFHKQAGHEMQCEPHLTYITDDNKYEATLILGAKMFEIFNVPWKWYNQRSGDWVEFTNTDIYKHLEEYKAGEDSLFFELDGTWWEVKSFSSADCMIPEHYYFKLADLTTVYLLTDHNTQLQYLVQKPNSDVEEWYARAKQAGLANDDDFGVKLGISFTESFPNEPPFIRVISPRMQFHTGHVTVGGSICTELLTTGTNNGWCKHKETQSAPRNLFKFLYNLIIDGGAKVDLNNLHKYTMGEAKEAFKRVASFHSWNA